MGTSTADVEREGGGAGGVAPPATQSFPKAGILPKIETQALQFIQQSECDGQGVVVAILDTGVDPGASGLKFTSDGRPKVIDIVDCTGSGDVDMSCERSAAAATKVEEKEKGGPCTVIEGLSGRKLKLSGSLVNPTNVWRVGVKRGYELYPKKLEGRVKEERKTKWAESQRAAVAAVRREMLDWKEAHPSPSPADNKAFQDLEEKLASLKSWDGADKEDPGPIFDVVAYNDGVDWQVLVGSQQDWKNDVCDLTAQTPLRDFDKDQAYGTLTELDSLNYGVHVYDEGKGMRTYLSEMLSFAFLM
jgi:tripeptidyl-peptidase-2